MRGEQPAADAVRVPGQVFDSDGRQLRRSLSTLGRINDHFVQAVQARSQMDLRVGAAFTRFQTLRLQKKFQLPGGGKGVVSYGPCQFPTLGFVVERWARIETFVPEDFWFLDLALRIPTHTAADGIGNGTATGTGRNGGGTNGNASGRHITFSWKRTRLYDRTLTLALYESCLDDGTAVVTHMNGRPKNKWRPVPLATVELQKRASMYLKIGSETLMNAAEQLYQQGYISYPRTETERFRPEFEHRPLIQDFASVGSGPFAAYANKLLHQNGFQTPRAGQSDDQAHPPITPCKAVDPATISDHTQRSVYTLVVKHYLACCSRDAVGRETTLTVKIASEEFTARGLMVQEKNWLEIYDPWERWSTGQGELPHVQIGSRVTPASLLMKEGRTTPPQPISEPELITLMDNCGIGTDATIAQHIATIQERDYASKDHRQRFLPTPLGIALIEGYNSMGYQLNKPDLRRETEHECNLVANGQKTKDDIVEPILSKMKDTYMVATRDAHKLDEAMTRHFQSVGSGTDMQVLQANFSECGKCHGSMALKQERDNQSGGGNGTAGGSNSRNPPRRLLFCNACQEGWIMPHKGQLRPKTEDGNNSAATKCAICTFQVVAIARGDGYEGNGYNVCPKCYSDPPPDHGGSGNGGSFPCFSCSHPTCPLAGGTQGGDVEVFPCPFCKEHQIQGGKAMLRKNTRGYTLSCSNFSSRHRCAFTVWLPRGSQSVSVPPDETNICTQCSTQGTVRKVSFIWKPGSVPPHLGRESTVCLLCDARFRQDVQIEFPRMDHVPSNNRPRQGRDAGTNRDRSNNGRGSGTSRTTNTGSRSGTASNNRTSSSHRTGTNSSGSSASNSQICYKCNQPGHFANACPGRRQ